jgi:hypothetical protein
MYWATGAMLGYSVLASWACAWQAELSPTIDAKPCNAIALTIPRFIDFLLSFGRPPSSHG